MFDIGWSELLVVAVVAIVVIGPRDLPAAMRTLGRAIGGMRRMAADFQSQFNDAMREAELDDLRREIAGLRDAARGIVQQVDVGTMAQSELDDIQATLEAKEAKLEAKEAEAADEQPDLFALPQPTPEPEEPDLFSWEPPGEKVAVPALETTAVPSTAEAQVADEPVVAAPAGTIALPNGAEGDEASPPPSPNGAGANGHTAVPPVAEPVPETSVRPRRAAAKPAAVEPGGVADVAIAAIPESPAHGG